METLIANLSGQVRREKLGGRDYLVAPLTLIVPGVLNGSKGPGYYPADEIQAAMDAWNHIPILLNHPANKSGRSPDVINDTGLGYLFNASFNGKLTAEGWFDIERSNKIDNRLIPAIERGDKVELSTGLGVKRDETPGVNNGKDYHWVARGHRPDHLAILLDGVGACSTSDGCGVNNSSELESMFTRFLQKVGLLKSSTDTPTMNQETDNMTKLTDVQRKTLVDELITNCSCTYKEEDRAALNAMDDAMLEKCKSMMATMKAANAKLKENEDKAKENEALINAARKGVEAGNHTIALNEKGEWVSKEKEKKEEQINNSQQPSKQAIKLEDLPAELQEDIQFARNAKQQRKNELIATIKNNKNNSFTDDELKGMPLAALDKMAKLSAQTTQATNQQQQTVPQDRSSYLGAGFFGPDSAQNQKSEYVPEPLGTLAWNFETADKAKN